MGLTCWACFNTVVGVVAGYWQLFDVGLKLPRTAKTFSSNAPNMLDLTMLDVGGQQCCERLTGLCRLPLINEFDFF